MAESWEQVFFVNPALSSSTTGVRLFQYISCLIIWVKATEKSFYGFLKKTSEQGAFTKESFFLTTDDFLDDKIGGEKLREIQYVYK